MKVKKFISVVLSFSLLLTMYAYNVSAFEPTEADKIEIAISKLVENNLTRNEILSKFSKKELLIFYNATDIECDTTYAQVNDYLDTTTVKKITKDECMRKVNSTYSNSSNTISEGGYLEQSIATAKIGEKYYITYIAEWLKSPRNRKTDVYGITMDGLHIDEIVINTFGYNKNFTDSNYNTTTTCYWKTPTYTSAVDGFAPQFNLPNDCSYAYGGVENYDNMFGKIGLYAVKANPNNSSAAICGQYLHQETSINITPSVSFEGLSITVTNIDEMHNIIPNPYKRIDL